MELILKFKKNDWVKKGQLKTLYYLSKIKKLLDDNKIKLVLVYYPSIFDILKGFKKILIKIIIFKF